MSEGNMIDIVACVEVKPKQSLRAQEEGNSKDSVHRMLIGIRKSGLLNQN